MIDISMFPIPLQHTSPYPNPKPQSPTLPPPRVVVVVQLKECDSHDQEPTLWSSCNVSDLWAKWPTIGSRSRQSLGVHWWPTDFKRQLASRTFWDVTIPRLGSNKSSHDQGEKNSSLFCDAEVLRVPIKPTDITSL